MLTEKDLKYVDIVKTKLRDIQSEKESDKIFSLNSTLKDWLQDEYPVHITQDRIQALNLIGVLIRLVPIDPKVKDSKYMVCATYKSIGAVLFTLNKSDFIQPGCFATNA